MGLIQPKQISKCLSAPIKIQGVTVLSGQSSATVTVAMTSALANAGNNGVGVPVQTSSNVFTPGIVTSPPINQTEVFSNTTKLPFTNTNGDEIYGRIALSSGDYVINLYYLSSGVETSYSVSGNTVIDFDFIYRFDFNTLPADALVATIAKNVMLDPRGQGAVPIVERLTVTGLNALSTLGNIPSAPTKTIIVVNGKEEFCLGGSPSFALSGASITWNAGNAGYSIETTDIVYAKYFM